MGNDKIALPALITAAFMGTCSHVFLDSMMHGDLLPFYPWDRSNSLLDIVSYGQLYLFCVLAGIIGIVILGITRG